MQNDMQDVDILKIPRVESRNNHDYSGLCHGGERKEKHSGNCILQRTAG